ncbi:hypothetical protein AKJ16_DCAP11013 [Drosera capensis]
MRAPLMNDKVIAVDRAPAVIKSITKQVLVPMSVPVSSKSNNGLAVTALDQGSNRQGSRKEGGRGVRSFSTRRMTATFASRSLRAKRRRAVLNTYRLSSFEDDSNTREVSKSQKLKQAAYKVKSAVVSMVASARFCSLKRCGPRSVAWLSSPFSFRDISFAR